MSSISSVPSNSPSAEFIKVINDFIRDVGTTFPEYTMVLQKWCSNHDRLYEFCVRKYIPHSDDFFNKNEEIFQEDSDVDTEFLPHIHFKNLWQYEDLSEHTKDAIWSYLQLITISLGVDREESPSSPTKEDMDEIVKNALEHMSKIWNKEADNDAETRENTENVGDPSVSVLDEHSTPETRNLETPSSGKSNSVNPDMFESLFTGKLASIAKELAEETAGSLSFSEDATIEDATKQLFSNPANLSSVMKTVSEKLDERMKSGEINQEELMAEAMSMMGKMSSIPGLGNLFNNLPNMAKNFSQGPSDFMRNPKVQQMSRQEKIKARLRNKVNNNNKQQHLNKNMK